MNNLGDRIYELRTSREMSQGDLAEKLDVSRQTISKWENNMSVPELDKILALSDIFGVTVDYIVKGEGEMPLPIANNFAESDYEADAEPVKVRMITVNPTEKYISGISIALGLIKLAITLFNVISNVGAFHNSLNAISALISVLVSVTLLSRKEKFISAAFVINAVYSVVNSLMNDGTHDVLYKSASVLSILFVVLTAVGYITANKKNGKMFSVSLIVLAIASFAFSCAYNYNSLINFVGYDVRSALISTFNVKIWTLPNLIVNIGLGVLINLKGNPLATYEIPENEYPTHNEMYVGMVKHILLQLFTFGIYNCIWIYKTTENLNTPEESPRQSGAKKLLLCIFVPFYILYWYYMQSKRLEAMMREKEMPGSDFAIITLLLAIFVPVVAASILLQAKINDCCEYAKN